MIEACGSAFQYAAMSCSTNLFLLTVSERLVIVHRTAPPFLLLVEVFGDQDVLPTIFFKYMPMNRLYVSVMVHSVLLLFTLLRLSVLYSRPWERSVLPMKC